MQVVLMSKILQCAVNSLQDDNQHKYIFCGKTHKKRGNKVIRSIYDSDGLSLSCITGHE